MSEEYCYSSILSARLKAECDAQQAAELTRLKAERDQAVAERDEVENAHTETIGRLWSAENERDEARRKRDLWANKTIDLARESSKHEEMLKAAQQLLLSRGNELLAARNSNIALRDELAKLQDRKPVRLTAHYNCTECTPKRPTGRIESLEARITALEALINAR